MKYVLLGGVILLVGAISWRSYFGTYQQSDRVNIHSFPALIGSWQAEELKISEAEYELLETRNAFVRRYSKGKDDHFVDLYIVYSENNRKVSHPPEICYTGNGFSVVEREPAELFAASGKKVDVNRLHLEKGDVTQLSYYFFKVGGSFTPSYWYQQTLIAWKTLIGQPSNSAMIRFSTYVVPGQFEAAEQRVAEFARGAIPLISQYLP
jgi:EpsI family protein